MDSSVSLRVSHSSLLVAALLVVAPSVTSAQAPTPHEAASTYVGYELGESGTSYDLSASETRLQRARRLRITGLTLMAGSVAMVGTMLLLGMADHSCDGTEVYGCVDGPRLWGVMGAALAAPVLVTGATLTTTGYVIERRERPRVSVTARGAGLRLTF
jgi:hypothetical protein